MNNYQNNGYNPNDPYGQRQGPPPYNNYQGGNGYGYVSPQWYNNDAFASGPSGKSRGIAALLALILGGLGIQYFYLGKSTAGIICLLISVVSCGILAPFVGLLALIQGILMFCMNNEAFEQKYAGPMSSTFPLF